MINFYPPHDKTVFQLPIADIADLRFAVPFNVGR